MHDPPPSPYKIFKRYCLTLGLLLLKTSELVPEWLVLWQRQWYQRVPEEETPQWAHWPHPHSSSSHRQVYISNAQ